MAAIAEENGAKSVEVETTSQNSENNQQRADISFVYEDVNYDVELKTPNTNWRMARVVNAHRPITENVSGIIKDARKLQQSSSNGLVTFVMFPIPPDDEQRIEYIHRIASELGAYH